MLIITREINQKILIGEGDNQVQLVYLGGSRGQVRLGFKAPRSVKIDRMEIRQQKEIIENPEKAAEYHDNRGNK